MKTLENMDMDNWENFKTTVRLFFETPAGRRAIAGAERGANVHQRLYEERQFKKDDEKCLN